MARSMEALGEDYRQTYDKTYNTLIQSEINEFKEIIKIAHGLHSVYTETIGTLMQWYFVTVRPDSKKCTFEEFYSTVHKYIHRKCIKYFYLSFEQKGTSEDELGNGFHAHMIIDGTWRSKAECLRDTKSSFNKIAAENCIQVIPTREPEKIKDKYLLEYESEDNHKIVTKEWDAKWREKECIDELYTNDLPGRSPPIKSGQVEISLVESL